VGKITIQVEVPDEYAETFRKEVEEIARFLRNKKRLMENMKKLEGIFKDRQNVERAKGGVL